MLYYYYTIYIYIYIYREMGNYAINIYWYASPGGPLGAFFPSGAVLGAVYNCIEMYVYTYICIYIHIYVISLSLYLSLSMYIYIYISSL